MGRSSQTAGTFFAVILAVGVTLPGVATAQEELQTVVFRSPAECINVLRFEPERCADIMQRAWVFYDAYAPRYSSRKDCWRKHQVCVPTQRHLLRLNEKRAAFRNLLLFGPPLWAIRINANDSYGTPEVLIDRRMVKLEPSGRTPIPAVGLFSPAPERIKAMYVSAYSTPPEQAMPAKGGRKRDTREPPQPAGGFSPRDSYPVAPHRLEAMRRAMRR
jgi:hypothetical protein